MQTLLSTYLTHLKTHGDPDEVYKWEAIDHYRQYWNIEADNFIDMFLEAFRKKGNLMYQNSWGFIRHAVNHFPDRVRDMFRDLFDMPLGRVHSDPAQKSQYRHALPRRRPALKAFLGCHHHPSRYRDQ